MSRETRPERTRRGGFPVVAVILIAVGIVLLLQTTGVLPWEAWNVIWRFWPVIIIAIGINIMLGRRMPWLAGILVAVVIVATLGAALFFVPVRSEVTVSSMQESLEGVQSVDVNIGFGAGQLNIGSLPQGSPNLVEASFRGRDAETSVVRSGDSADLNISMRDVDFPFFGDGGGTEWTVSLSGSPELSLDLDGGAADMNLDLTGLNVTEIDVDTGAADVEITMPANSGHVTAKIDAGAADITVIIPEGVAARIDADVSVGSLGVDEGRFPKVGDVHVSPDFDTAENRIDLEIDAGASSVTVE